MDDSRSDAPDPLLGRVLDGRYRIVALIGSGGIGTVYRAIHLTLDRSVAIKVLRPEFAQQDEFLARFDREARALSRLTHVNVVTVTDFGVSDGFPYLVMELLSGSSLEDEIDRGAVTLPRAVTIGRQILGTLAYAHTQGVVHRDLKPQNVVLIDQPGMRDLVKILDFGLAKVVGLGDGKADRTLTRHGAIFGTPAYMSPEQSEGHPADARSDVYSMGVLVFEMLARRPPFVAENTNDLLRHHIMTRPPRMGDVAPLGTDIPELFERVVARALQKGRGARYQTADQMLAAFEEAARVSGIETSVGGVPASVPTTSGRASGIAKTMPATPGMIQRHLGDRRAEQLRRLGAALVIVLLGVLGLQPWGPSRPSRHGRSHTPVAHRTAPRKSAPAAPAPARTPVSPAPPPVSRRPDARDPWQSPELAPELREIVAQLDAGNAEEAERISKAYVKEHRSDPVGHLALGHGYCARGWRRDCLLRYRMALRLDESIRGDPRMLSEVVTALGDPRVATDAAEMLRVVFGAAAVPLLVGATTQSRTVEGGHLATAILGELGASDRVDPIAVAISDLTRARQCEDRALALEILRASRDPRVRPALERQRTNLDVTECIGDVLEQAIGELR